MKYTFHPGALEEYLGMVDYYAAVGPQLAEAFVDEVEAGIARILAHPEAWSPLEGGVRRCLLKRFPFGVYYCVEDEMVVVHAIMHMSRRPDYWRNRTNQGVE